MENEEKDLYGGYSTYIEHYNAEKDTIMLIHLKYEKHNDSLQEAIDQISAKDQNCDNTDSEDDDKVTENTEDLGFFDPEQPEDHTVHDIGADKGCDPKYMTEHYEINT